LLNRLLYARFAWALCRIVKDSDLSEKLFKFNEQEISNDRGKGTKIVNRMKRQRLGNSLDDSSRANTSNQKLPKGDLLMHRFAVFLLTSMQVLYLRNSAMEMKHFLIKVSNQQIASFCFLINSIESQQSVDSEEHAKAQQTLPHLCMCYSTCVRLTHNVIPVYGFRPPTKDEFEDVIWYPGRKAVERRKLEYIRRHPQIQAYSGPFLPDNYSLDDEE
jgi:hypothetical protein